MNESKRTAISQGSGTAGTGNIDQSRHTHGGSYWWIVLVAIVIAGTVYATRKQIARVIFPGGAELEMVQPDE